MKLSVDHQALRSLAQIDLDAAFEYFDGSTVERGIAYAQEARVQIISIKARTIRAACEGTRRQPYLVSVSWYDDDHGGEVSSECSCPVGNDCKHGVAAFAVARAEAIVILGAEAVGPPTGEDTAAAPLRNDWRQVLGDPEEPVSDHGPALPMAIELRMASPRHRRWSSDDGPRILARPLRTGAHGRWVKGGAGWRDVASPYCYELQSSDPRHLAALRALTSAHGGGYDPGAEVELGQFDATIWPQLALARDSGVALLDAKHQPTVDLATDPARVEIALTAAPRGVAISVGFRLGGPTDPGPVDPGPVDPGPTDPGATEAADLAADGGGSGRLLGPEHDWGTVGSVPHGIWHHDGERLVLAPLAAPLTPGMARLLAEAPLTVPEHDVDEFLDHYPEAFARHASVHSPDGSVTIATNRFDGVVLAVTRTDVATAELAWFARYRRGERTTHHPLGGIVGAGRHLDDELDALAALDLPTTRLPGLVDLRGRPTALSVTGAALITLLDHVLPDLEAQGVIVELHDGHPELREAVDGPRIGLAVAAGSARRDGTDWFDLDVTVTVDGQEVPFPELFAALDRGDEVLILPSGTWLRLDLPELDRLRDLLAEARGLAEPNSGHDARINRFQADWWHELAELGVVDTQTQAWVESVTALAELDAPASVDVPPNLKAELRSYQQDGLDWLAFLHANRLGGILADDMGLGKTIQALALALHVKAQDPEARFLVIAPTSVIDNWARETERFAPDLTVRTVTETARRRGSALAEAIEGADVVVTSYTLFRLEFDDYAEVGWELLLLDEAQFVKNHQGKTHQCVRRLDAATKLAITGTPLENSLMDLWSLLSITAPGLYPDPKRFDATFRKPIESGEAPELLATLRRRIAPLMRRRTKDAVLPDLPPKIEQTVEVELNARHARIYDTQLQRQRQKVLGLVGDVTAHRFEILKSLTVLRQLALDPALVDDDHHHVGSAKIDRLLDDLVQIVAEGHRALVFSQFTRFLGRIRDRLDAAGIEHSYLDGKTHNRDAAIARFKDGDVPVFLISLKAGGFGLNLTEADYCFVMDPWWNPAVETQAVDRAHRIGQERSVIVYRYVSADTIENKVMELKARKADLFASVVDADGALAGALTESDIRGLLDL